MKIPMKKKKAAKGHGKFQLHTCPYSGFIYAENFCDNHRYTNRPARQETGTFKVLILGGMIL